MSVRSLNWLKFGGLVGSAFMLGLLFAGLLDLPTKSLAEERGKLPVTADSTISGRSTTASLANSSLVTLSEDFANVAEQVRPSVVYIRSMRTERTSNSRVRGLPEEFFQFPRKDDDTPETETGAGSGFLVSEDGYILTNNHVVDGANAVTVRLLDRHEFPAKVVGRDPVTDVAVIKIEPRKGVPFRPAKLGKSAESRVGEWVLAVGNPLSESLSFTVTSGIISAKGRGRLALPGQPSDGSIQDFLQTDAAINRGNSGGPLLNVRGEVIGINSAIYSPTGISAGYAFAIPIDLAKQVMDQLIAHGKFERSVIGVSVDDATATDAEDVGLPEIRGVIINQFIGDKSPAKKAGLQEGDVIISVDGDRVDYTAQLQQLIGFKRPGQVVSIEVAREGGVRKKYDVKVVGQADAGIDVGATGDQDGSTQPGATPELIKKRLGATVGAITPEFLNQAQLPDSIKGVMVESVDPYGPAEGVLGRYDIITQIEGKAVGSVADVRQIVQGAKEGEILSLRVVRPGGNNRLLTKIVRIKLN